MGEPAGIGGELALKAWAERIGKAVPPFVLLDDPDRIRALAKRIGLDVPVEVVGGAARGGRRSSTAPCRSCRPRWTIRWNRASPIRLTAPPC